MPKRVLGVVCLIAIFATGIQMAAARPPQIKGAAVITPDNVTDVVELARLGRGTINQVALSPDGATVAVATTLGVWAHDAASVAVMPILWIETPDVLSLAYSPDGTQLATSNGQGEVMVWNVEDGSLIVTLSAENPDSLIHVVAFSPDSQTVAIGGQDGSVRLWNVASNEATRLNGHTAAVTDVKFMPDGSQVVSVSNDLTIRIWDVVTGTEVANYAIEDDKGLASLAISPDGSLLIVGGEEAGIHIVSAATGTRLAILTGHIGQVNRLVFSPDGSVLASGGIDQIIRLWDVTTLGEIAELTGHTDWLRGLVFSPDGSQLVSVSWDNSVRLWDVATATQLEMVQGYTGRVVSIAFGPDGSLIASADASIAGLLRLGSSNVRLWDLNDVSERFHSEQRDSLARVFFGPEGDAIASASNDGILRQWAVSDGRDLGYGSGTLMGFNKDWTKALFRIYENDVIQVVDLQDTIESNRQLLYGHEGLINAAVMDGVDLLIATAGKDGTVRLWSAEDAKPVSLYTVGGQGRSVAFNADSSLLAAGDSDGVVHVWSVDSDEEVHRLTGHTGTVESVTFSPDGSLLVSAGGDGTVRVWDVTSGIELATFHHAVGTVAQVVFNPDGTLLASGGDDGTVRVWGLK